MTDERVFLVIGQCEDYYCESHHPVGVFRERAEAEAVSRDDPALRGEGYGPVYCLLDVIELPVGRPVLVAADGIIR